MRIWVPGANGLLGRAVCKIAAYRDHEVVGTSHGRFAVEDSQPPDATILNLRSPDTIINCAGVLPGHGYRETVLANTLGPHSLASVGLRLVHMSTDCVFSGRKYPTQNGYGLDSGLAPDPVDLYGRTKLAGEPSGDHVLVVPGSFIGEGLNSPDSFGTCSHGAGRVMGRKVANRTITHERAVESMAHVVYGVREGKYDEMPDCYKGIDAVMEAQADLVTPVNRLVPLMVVKG
ncbi:hypothetical protein LCGC14_1720880 [marine sediment metagenome]|uniref:3'-phosphate/5'-hydroxy nucleic acid ligase n=1 Tax=marine sediment metagenome TaxID=412755 RepID=A0A0F9HCJ8_9ZZZZ